MNSIMPEQAEGLAAQRDPVARFMRVVGRLFGMVFLVAGLAWLGEEIRFGWAAQSASGTIVEVRARESAEGLEFYPVVEFAAPDGRVIRFEGVSTSPPPVAGTPVKMLYDPAQPNRARINSVVQRWVLGPVFASIGVAFLAAVSAGRAKRTRNLPTSCGLGPQREDYGPVGAAE
jgi:hypothetical protein